MTGPDVTGDGSHVLVYPVMRPEPDLRKFAQRFGAGGAGPA